MSVKFVFRNFVLDNPIWCQSCLLNLSRQLPTWCNPKLAVMESVKINRPLRISVEGNIGCGKSTLIKYFEQFSFVETHGEPLQKWRDVQGHNLLGLLYEDLTRWNSTFQSYVQLTRTQIQSSTAAEGIKVQMFERSVQNNRYCFMENAYQSGLLAPPEYAVLCTWYDWIQENIDVSLDLIVYLKSKPEVVYERITSRNRCEEKKIPLEYLQSLHAAHENWLSNPNLGIPVLTIDANRDLGEIRESYEDIIPFLYQDHQQVLKT